MLTGVCQYPELTHVPSPTTGLVDRCSGNEGFLRSLGRGGLAHGEAIAGVSKAPVYPGP